ncbi:hypothetical protein BO83DRAFT_421879 [Aspergillus eucalypticola CBS 122712]|uniref:Uncharacterized protein n=1 Tax=Aspergillus eucalypticola (strain CBS 122712 / IBT 29274) TaxID=1448314 RepID=A0A317UN75_ASPEC|nr:uncharacterized protein BO83DRAFT_421879 [Aspergillus eucalypticola CBS 122712]PWY61992.1 hypothetical protein BO83DRAFT_421879 [Aspergillus eucalypticola CBS 122712]
MSVAELECGSPFEPRCPPPIGEFSETQSCHVYAGHGAHLPAIRDESPVPFHHSISISAAPVQWGALQQQHHAMAHAMLSAYDPLPDPTPSSYTLPSNDPPMVESLFGPAYGTVQQSLNPPGRYPQCGQSSIVPNQVASNSQSSVHLNYQQQL